MPRAKARSEPAWPADRVERRPVGALIENGANARTHSDQQVEQIAASIRQWGFTSPVLITPKGMIVAGHGRVRAARLLGLTDVPVMVASGWTNAQIRAYALADNKLALNAGWDESILRLELAALQDLGFDLDLTGFSAAEIAVLNADAAAGLTDPDEAPALSAEPPVSRADDVWILGRHRLLCGDATEARDVGRLLGQVEPHLMVTDPPYGVEYDPSWRKNAGLKQNTARLGKVANDNRADWRDAWALFPGSVVYVWHAGRYASIVQDSLAAVGFEVRSQIIWAKDRFALSRGHYHWQHEPCWYAVRNGPASWSGDRRQSTLWNIPAREGPGFDHGTQKPVECMKRPIENNSSPGQAVYEPFCGSGSTIIAAEITARSCLAIELMPAYVDLAITRWQDFTGDTARLEADGRTYAAVAAGRRPEARAC